MDFINSGTQKKGLRNILDVNTEIRFVMIVIWYMYDICTYISNTLNINKISIVLYYTDVC